jgi:rare lipoprotein A
VKNLENGRTALVVIQDRGPRLRSRVLDVSPRTATQLGIREQGTAMVQITPLAVPRGNRG